MRMRIASKPFEFKHVIYNYNYVDVFRCLLLRNELVVGYNAVRNGNVAHDNV